jgi:hypothetical protein
MRSQIIDTKLVRDKIDVTLELDRHSCAHEPAWLRMNVEVRRLSH